MRQRSFRIDYNNLRRCHKFLMCGSTKKKKRKKKAFLYAACFAKEQQNSKTRRKIVAKGTEALHHSNTRRLKPFFFFLVCTLDLLFKNRFVFWSHSLCDRSKTDVVLSLFIYIKSAPWNSSMPCHVTLRRSRTKTNLDAEIARRLSGTLQTVC